MTGYKKKELIAQGAEAEIWKGTWRERDAIIKRRIGKGYRHPELDSSLRRRRIRKEARLMSEARKVGVPVPIIYDLIEKDTTLIMQYFPGKRVMDCLEEGIEVDLRKIGVFVGRLHEGWMTHGDLTTSNILYDGQKDNYCFIDFSLGEKNSNLEDMGVDMHLMREALISVHDDPLRKYESILSGYRESFVNSGAVLERVETIEGRGRYR